MWINTNKKKGEEKEKMGNNTHWHTEKCIYQIQI